MAAIIDVENPAALRRDGVKAPSAAFGSESARTFSAQPCGGTSDWTKERRELPELGFERLTAELKQFDAEVFLGRFGQEGTDIIAAKNARCAMG